MVTYKGVNNSMLFPTATSRYDGRGEQFQIRREFAVFVGLALRQSGTGAKGQVIGHQQAW